MTFFAGGKLIAAAGAVAFCLLTCVAQAASCGTSAAGFEQWKVEFAEEAKAAGVKKKGMAALAGAKYAAEPSGPTAPPSRLSAGRSTTL